MGFRKRLRFVLAGVLIGWITIKILNRWVDEQTVYNLLFLIVLVIFIGTFVNSIHKGGKAYKNLKKPEPTAEELSGIKIKASKNEAG